MNQERSDGIVRLRPPLKPRFEVQYEHVVYNLPIVNGGRLYLETPSGVEARDEATGDVVWKQDLGAPVLVRGNRLITKGKEGPSEALEVVDVETGRLQRTIRCRQPINILAVGDLLVCRTSHDGPPLFAVDLKGGETLWQWRPEGEAMVKGSPCADSEAVYFGLSDGSLMSLHVRSGKERWRGSVADLTWQTLGPPQHGQVEVASPVVVGDRVLFEACGGRVVGVSTRDGTRAWVHQCRGDVAQSRLYQGRYYGLVLPGELLTLDPKDGRVLGELDLNRQVPRPKLRVGRLTAPLLVTETHVFTGTEAGFVLAFQRENGTYVWSHRPKGGASTDYNPSPCLAANGRFYYADMSLRMYCLEEDHEAAAEMGKKPGRRAAVTASRARGGRTKNKAPRSR